MHNTIKKILVLCITIGILFYLFLTLDISASTFSAISNWQYLYVAMLLPLTILPFVSTNRWSVFLAEVGIQESCWKLWRINLVSLFQGLILPSSQGFDALRIYHIEKLHPEARGEAGSTILIERLLGFGVFCAISFISSLIIEIPNKIQVVFAIGLISFVLVVFCFVLMSKKIHGFFTGRHFDNKLVARIYGYVDKFYKSLTVFPYKKVLGQSVLLICLYQLCTIISVYLIYKAYGIELPLYIHLSLYPIISIISMVPITISGFGVREGFFVYFYSFLGVPPEIAVVVSIMNYMILTLEPALVGGGIYLVETITNKK